MKKMAVSCLILFLLTNMQAQTNKNYSVKAEYLFGRIMQHTRHLERLVKGPVMGAEVALEWQTMGEQNWHQYFAFPSIGGRGRARSGQFRNAWSAGGCVSLSEFQIVRWTKLPDQSERWCRHEFSEQNL